jgi:hypothetical protein
MVDILYSALVGLVYWIITFVFGIVDFVSGTIVYGHIKHIETDVKERESMLITVNIILLGISIVTTVVVGQFV